jgi:imidazoleglycerol-phosphate dehydratase
MSDRKAKITRSTETSKVKLALDLDGAGRGSAETGIPFLDQMLLLLARQGGFNLEVHCACRGGDPGEAAEAVAFCLGLALERALGDRKGIARGGHAYAAVEEHLARAVVEFSGHPCLVYRVGASVPAAFGIDSRAVEDFWRTFVSQARLTLHLELLYGGDGMPSYEAIFKAAARALSQACALPGSRRTVGE